MTEGAKGPVCQVVQPAFAAQPNSPAATAAVRESILDMAGSGKPADLIVLPEYSNACGLNQPELLAAVAADNSFEEELAEIAARRKSYLLLTGVAARDGELRNRATCRESARPRPGPAGITSGLPVIVG